MSISKVIFAGIFSYPTGNAASSRIKNLALGMVDNGQQVNVQSMYTEQPNIENLDNSKIRFNSVVRKEYNKKSKIHLLYYRVRLYLMIPVLVRNIINELDGSKDDILFLYGRSFIFLCLLLITLKILNYKTTTIFDVVEPHRTKKTRWEYVKHPFVWDSALVFKLLLNRFSFCTYITKELYREYPIKLNSHYILPGVMNKVLKNITDKKRHTNYSIAYVGALIGKDYPELLFKFCCELNKQTTKWKLKVIGRFEFNPEGLLWVNKFKSSFTEYNVSFYNDPSDEEKESLLKDVDYVAVFRKPLNLQKYTFPTRAVEVMSEGKVIITNSFGEFCNYITERNAGVIIDDNNIAKTVEFFVSEKQEYYNQKEASAKLFNSEFNSRKHCYKLLKMVNAVL